MCPMLCVRCPYCNKVVGFDEADAGLQAACPFCQRSFLIPAVARPVAEVPAPPPVVVPAVIPEPPPIPDELSLADESQPPAEPPVPVITEALPEPEPESPPLPPEPEAEPLVETPRLLPPEPPAVEAPPPPVDAITATPPQPLSTLVVPPYLPEAKPEDEGPVDVLEEITEAAEEEKPDREKPEARARPRDEEDEEEEERERRRRRARRREKEYPLPFWAQPARDGWLTRRRISGIIGLAAGAIVLLFVVFAVAFSRSSTPTGFVCLAGVFGGVLFLGGLYYLTNEG